MRLSMANLSIRLANVSIELWHRMGRFPAIGPVATIRAVLIRLESPSVRWLRLVVVLAVVAATAAVPGAARGQTQPAQKQDEREIQARELFGFGRYLEALAL